MTPAIHAGVCFCFVAMISAGARGLPAHWGIATGKAWIENSEGLVLLWKHKQGIPNSEFQGEMWMRRIFLEK